MKILEKVEVEYVTFEGWKAPIKDCKTFDSLPENAKKYVQFIQDFLQVPGILSIKQANKPHLISIFYTN